jgi:hypothetical protein
LTSGVRGGSHALSVVTEPWAHGSTTRCGL